jgi:hypothetical protein
MATIALQYRTKKYVFDSSIAIYVFCAVRIKVVGDHLFVSVMVNDGPRASLLLDTGGARTILRPALLECLGVTVSAHAPRWTIRLVGGQTIAMPFARIRSLKIAELTVDAIDVGVYEAFPTAQHVDGLLGADFLSHFRITVDRHA